MTRWCGGLVVVISALIACDDTAPPVVPGRVVAVTGKAVSGPDLAGFCDRYAADEQAAALVLPALDSAAPTPNQRPRWVNIWATWCKPCVEEMPRLLAWQKRLAAEGRPLELVFVSVDATADAVAEFRAQHSDMPESLHVAAADTLSTWLPQIGLGEGSPIPMHLYADSRGAQRCVRAGAVAETDFSFVEALLQRHP